MDRRLSLPDNVGMNERIGRRFFDEPMLRGAEGQPSFSGVELHHFQDKRDNEISLDRLGATGVEKRVIRYLKPRAEAAGFARRKAVRFEGWLHVTARELTQARQEPKLPVIASPVDEPEPDDNCCHAHVVKPDTIPEAVRDYLLALHLRQIISKYGGVQRNEGETSENLWDRLTAWLFNRIGWPRQFGKGL